VRLNSFGADVLLVYLQKLQPDILLTLADVWWLTYITSPFIANFMRIAGIPWALYYPIDGDLGDGRLPPSWVRILKTVDLPIAMSAYGREVTRANGVTPEYIPHGVEANIFCPPADRSEAKRRLGYEGKFVILSDARNQPRKLLPRTLEIFSRFAADKDDVLLHLHCDPEDPAAQTPEYRYNLLADLAYLGLTDKVRLSAGMRIEKGLPLEQLAAIYQAADVHLLSSWGEGFGLPSLQAAAAGVVPMASDYTASRELVAGHGEALRVHHFCRDQFGLRRAWIDIDDAVGRLEKLYYDRTVLAAKAEASHCFAQAYDWRHIIPQWDEMLKSRVKHLRQRVRQPAAASRLELNRPGSEVPAPLAQAVRSALPFLPDGAQVTVNVVESRAGELSAGILQDASSSAYPLTIPVTLPPPGAGLIKERVAGCIFLASESEAPVARRLGKIFPGLNAWSVRTFELGKSEVDGRPVYVKAVPRQDPDFRRHLAATTLALDLQGSEAWLPALAAELGVPCISHATQVEQQWLWPELSLPAADEEQATRLGRWLLTDQGDAAELCEQAYARLTLRQAAAS
jgi:glycosyltransferase involved in cell wall biosynthesis